MTGRGVPLYIQSYRPSAALRLGLSASPAFLRIMPQQFYISSILLSNQIFHVIYKYCVYMLRSINFFHVYVANLTMHFLYMCYCVYFISVYIDLLFTFDDESVTNNNEAVYIYFCLYQCFYLRSMMSL